MNRTRIALLALLVTASSLLAACGGGGGASATATTAPSAATLQTEFVDVVQSVLPSVVEVETRVGLGSGVVYDSRGNIVTNHHVVGTAKTFKVTDSNGRSYTGTLVGTFPAGDLAVIHVKGANLKPATFGDSSALEVGDIVLAMGSPLGYQGTVTEGIVSSLGRTVSERTRTALPDVIQTSAAINPGNSGGALVNLAGRVIGIPTLDAIDTETNQLANSIGFAIPSNTVKSIAGQIVQNGRVVDSGRAYLGARLATPATGSGVVVVSVTPGGPAAAAGIAARDRLTAIEGKSVSSIDEVATMLANLKPSTKIPVTIRTPAGAKRTVTVTLGEYPG